MTIIYDFTFNTICIEGTVNVIDDKAVITFDPFTAEGPSELEMPSGYNFSEGSKVNCKVKTITVIDLRYFYIKDVSLVN